MMTATSIGRMVLPSLALVTACGAAIAFGVTQMWREPPLQTRAAAAAPVTMSPAPGAPIANPTALATARAEAAAMATELALSPPTPISEGSAPVFDVARIEKTGEAVIAGRAAPGATVELLRNGERHDGAVADQSGLFVMVPPRLPAGNYQLTLRSRLPDGTLATSSHAVAVALEDVASTGNLPSTAAESAMVDKAVADRRAQQNAPVAQPPRATLVAALPDGGAPSSIVKRKIATTVVSPGDSLWRISRSAYGVGARYAFLYKANRERIRDPNLIFPGQIFVVPARAR